MNGYSKRKAALVTLLFVIAGAASLAIHRFDTGVDWVLSLPLIIFYLVLCINTYFSIRLFAFIIPRDNHFQNMVDILLAFLYLMLAWFLYDRNLFIFIASLMFAAATIKYSSILGTNPYLKLFKRKIFTDNIGAFGTIVAYGGSIFIHPAFFVWLWMSGFVLANVYLLIINPLYTLTDSQM